MMAPKPFGSLTNIALRLIQQWGRHFYLAQKLAKKGYQVYAIAQAIDHFIKYPDEAKFLGEKRREAVLEKCNWDIEENKLLNFYSSALDT